MVTLEICVLIGMPLNFANIIALPLLLGVGVAFKIYYIMAWRAGQTEPLAVEPDPGRDLERADHRDRVRQPVAFEPSRHVQHGQAPGAVAGDCTMCAAVLFQPALMGKPRNAKEKPDEAKPDGTKAAEAKPAGRS